jgi:hypothetical protein
MVGVQALLAWNMFSTLNALEAFTRLAQQQLRRQVGRGGMRVADKRRCGSAADGRRAAS